MVYQHHHSRHSYPQKNLATASDLRETVETFSFHGLGKGRILRWLASGVLLKYCETRNRSRKGTHPWHRLTTTLHRWGFW